ncbi:MAG: 1-deoxy-D-xylulose-5-phosphate reductoisomerase [Armatimonadetes bacterium]|nr:1-deoxy-D-xylulose-5-phosphate reductoisomerase [Armatimonadota bacterium]MDW8029142.1 1-deoxy-D-xylulose-5-phosphate reductoisomerase [Armatimonadota bacterium]
MKGVSIIGATGSIGRQTLDIIAHHPDKLRVVGLTAGRDFEALSELAFRWRPKLVAFFDLNLAEAIKGKFDCPVLFGIEGLTEVATHPDAEIVVVAIPTAKALLPTLAALKAGKRVALATKEVLVSGGHLIVQQLKQSGELLPIDSEHSALFQCLQGEDVSKVDKLILTASGGPFRTKPLEDLKRVSVEEALAHPTWKMGAKVTVDSATLMNKGLEIIEARWLFGISPERIEVVVHPQSIVHSLVEFVDGSVKAQLSLPDMRLPIQYALLYPERHPCPVQRLELTKVGTMNFEPPDEVRFPCLRLAKQAAKVGGTMPTVMNAADEIAVNAFLRRQIGFMDIPAIVEAVMERHCPIAEPSLETVWEVDDWSRNLTSELIRKFVAS